MKTNKTKYWIIATVVLAVALAISIGMQGVKGSSNRLSGDFDFLSMERTSMAIIFDEECSYYDLNKLSGKIQQVFPDLNIDWYFNENEDYKYLADYTGSGLSGDTKTLLVFDEYEYNWEE